MKNIYFITQMTNSESKNFQFFVLSSGHPYKLSNPFLETSRNIHIPSISEPICSNSNGYHIVHQMFEVRLNVPLKAHLWLKRVFPGFRFSTSQKQVLFSELERDHSLFCLTTLGLSILSINNSCFDISLYNYVLEL